jgi:hypothetical protein
MMQLGIISNKEISMKIILIAIGLLVLLVILAVITIALLTPWMDRWGATAEEIAGTFPGDELVPEPASFVNRAITIQAAPEYIYPWIVQLDARKGGWYSYTWLETHLMKCPMVNADRIHPEWQNLKVGDEVRMCPDGSVPPPYIVAQILPNQAIVLGHQEDGEWVDLYQFVIVPQESGSSRLILRTRTMAVGGMWTFIHPGVFVMERGMLNGIKERAEQLAQKPDAPAILETPTPTPEVFNPLSPSPTPSGSELPLTCQITDLNVYIDRAAGYCFAYPLRFTLGDQPSDKPDVRGPAIGSPAEPVFATFGVEVNPAETAKSLEDQARSFTKDFSVVDPDMMTWRPITVGGEPGLIAEPVPVQLSWRIIFVEHDGRLYRLMYWPVDVPEAETDLDELYQTTINTFAFTP